MKFLLVICCIFLFVGCGEDDKSMEADDIDLKEESSSSFKSNSLSSSKNDPVLDSSDAMVISSSSANEEYSSSIVDQGGDSNIKQSSSSYSQKKSSSSSVIVSSSSSVIIESSSQVQSSSSYNLVDNPNVSGTAWDYLNPEFNYGEFTDERDGQVYKTIKIGRQVWMAQNLNYPVNPGVQSWGYVNTKNFCSKWGYLYSWAAAIDSSALAQDETSPRKCGYREKDCNLPAKWRGICPVGWHIPSMQEFKTLIEYTGNTKTSSIMLRAKNGWYEENGYDNFGFSALPAGDYYMPSGSFGSSNGICFWSSTDYTYDEKYNSENAKVLSIPEDAQFAFIGNGNKGAYAYSVRCVSDEEAVENDYVDQSVFDENLNELTDVRDGRVYRTVKIGEQVWMAENLAFNTDLRSTDLSLKSRCYNDSLINCEKYGRLYSLNAALNGDDESRTKVRGVCPKGWHLPKLDEWHALVDIAGGAFDAMSVLKDSVSWKKNKGSDDLGFSLLAAGSYADEKFYDIGSRTSIWTSTCAYNSTCYSASLNDDDGSFVGETYQSVGEYMLSVRCLKDE